MPSESKLGLASLPKRSILVSFLFLLFGISSWVEVNGLWVELPVLVQTLPEGWYLASYIVVIAQLGNTGPLLYTLLRQFFKGKRTEIVCVHLTLVIGTFSCLFLAIFWSRTAEVWGNQHSVALLTLAFLLSFVDCTSSVLYLPYLAYFREIYLLPLLIGEGMSGLLPGLIALAQGVGGNPECRNVTTFINETYSTTVIQPWTSPPRFSVEVFFGFLTAMMVVSWGAFILLSVLPAAKRERVDKEKIIIPKALGDEDTTEEENSISKPFTFTSFIIILLAIQAFICALTNGILPSIQTFSVLPYGNYAYHLAATLGSISNPLACFIAIFIPMKKMFHISFMLVIGLGFTCYIMATAVLSPAPPMMHELGGSVLVIISWILFHGIMSYIKASIAAILRSKGGHSALYWCGIMTQVGSSIGALIMFFIVNYTNTFQAYYACS